VHPKRRPDLLPGVRRAVHLELAAALT
jgi:hypothetical protein